VPGLDASPLPWAGRAPRSGDDAVAAGYPGGGEYRSVPVRVRTVLLARGESIYGKAGVEREVIAFRGNVVPGNSGGPLLNPRGAVLGMVFGAGISDASTGYAITADELQEISATRGSRAVSTGSCRLRGDE
jgi:S1-C subfamily serine protease